MDDILKNIIDSLNFLNKTVNNTVLNPKKIEKLHNILKKFNRNKRKFNKLTDKLLIIQLPFNDDKVISLLIDIHQSLSQLIECFNATDMITFNNVIHNYEQEWEKINHKNINNNPN